MSDFYRPDTLSSPSTTAWLRKPDCRSLKDVEDGFQWVREKGPALFGIDPDRMIAVGQSAGAYLALVAGARVQPRLKAIVSFYGYGDIAGEWLSRPSAFYLERDRVSKEAAYGVVGTEAISESPPTRRGIFYTYTRQTGTWPQEVAGLDPTTDAEKFAPYTPERLVTREYPPTLLLHGDRDTDVPFQMSERMAAVFLNHNVAHRLYRMPGFDHVFDVFPDGLPPAGKPIGLQHPAVAEAFDVVLSFIAVHVGTR